MKRPAKRRLTAILVTIALMSGVLATEACSNQGEGEVCQLANDNGDCQTEKGLRCYDAKQLNNTTSDRCCPEDRTRSTHPACKTPIAVVTSDAQAPADTGPSTSTADAQVTTDASDAGRATDASDQ